MPNLPISQLPFLSGATNNSLLAIVYSGTGTPVTYHISVQDLIKSSPFGTVYQTILPDVTNTYDLGSPSNTFKSIHVGEGTVFIGTTGALGIGPEGFLYSLSGFATNELVLGGVVESGVTTTSGVTFSLNENYDVIVTNPTNTGVTYNITQQLVTTGGTVGDVFTKTGSSFYDWGWVSYSANTSGTSGSSGTSGTDGSSGTSGSSGLNGTSGTSGSSGTNGTSGTSGSSGTSAPPAPFPPVYGLFAQTGDSATISGTTTESTLIDGGVGTLTVSANTFSVGDSFRVDMSGILNAANNQTIRVRLKSGSVILADSGIQNITNITNDVWELSVNFTVRNVGGPGTASIVSVGAFHYSKTSNGVVEGFSFNTVNNSTFDTTINNTLDITVEWGSTSVGNNITTDIFVLNKIY